MKCTPSVYVTGAGCISAAGRNIQECMESLFAGRSSPQPPTRFTSTHSAAYPVFEAPVSSIPDVLRSDPTLSLTAMFALAAAAEALRDAGLDPAFLQDKRVGVCMGTTVGAAMNNEEFYRDFLKGSEPDMAPIGRYLKSNPASAIASRFNLTGPCSTIVNACSSGTDAVGVGASWIDAGLCDIVITGGADELCHVTYNGFISLMITDEKPCKPFDRDRKGLNLGEGAAALVLESEESARKRGKKTRASFLAYASASDAHHLTAPHPEGRGLEAALREALRRSGLNAENIAFVNAHGTATLDNDRVESNVLNRVLPGIPFVSTKGHTGHALGAAGAIEAAFTVACLGRGMIPATAGFSHHDPDLPRPPVAKAEMVTGRAAVSQSLAFGGSNGVLILGRVP